MAQIAGLLLAGGKSRRFGAPKALALLQGRAVIAHVAERLGASTLAVAGDEAAARAAGALHLADPPGASAGPVAGIAAGLAWAEALGADWLVISPCDTPLLPRDMAQRLAAGAGEAPGAIVRTDDGLQPLCAILRPSLQGVYLDAAMAAEHEPVHGLARRCGAVQVFFAEAEAFLNVNTRADLARAEALLRG